MPQKALDITYSIKFTVATKQELKYKSYVMEMSPVSLFLKGLIERKKRDGVKLSLRRIAKIVDISPGRLSEILSGKRNLTLKVGLRFVREFEVGASDKRIFLELIRAQPKIRSKKIIERRYISPREFAKISHWSYYCLLCLLEVEKGNPSPDTYSRRMKIPSQRITTMLNQLEQTKLIFFDGNRYIVNETTTTTSQDKLNLYIQNFHLELMREIEMRCSWIPLEHRDLQSLIIPIDISKMRKAKKLIRSFVDKFSREIEGGKMNHVYALNVQLMPLTLG